MGSRSLVCRGCASRRWSHCVAWWGESLVQHLSQSEVMSYWNTAKRLYWSHIGDVCIITVTKSSARTKVYEWKANACCSSFIYYNYFVFLCFVFPTIQQLTYNSRWTFFIFWPLLMLEVDLAQIGWDEQRHMLLFRGLCVIQGVEWISSCSTRCANSGVENWVLFILLSLIFFRYYFISRNCFKALKEALLKFVCSKW